jgi:hypothetical protein
MRHPGSDPGTATRRRLWPVFVPLALVLALAILWTGLWYFAVAAAEGTIVGWREREAKEGRIHTCAQQTISGFPFRIEVRCVDPGLELRQQETPVALKAGKLLVVAQVYQPTLLIVEFAGPMTITEPGQAPSYMANWALGQASLRGTPAAPERVSIVVDRPAVDRVGGAAPTTVLKADRIELHGRMIEGFAADNPVIELALRLAAATAPELHTFMTRPVDADIAATLRGLADFSPQPWPVRFRELQARGGRIEITRARVQQGDAIAVSAGTLGLTARGGLDGQIQVTIVGLESIVRSFDFDRITSQGNVAATIGALDRLVPGLGQIARQNAGPGVIVGLRAMGKATTIEGQPAITLPLRFADGQVLLGPFPVGRIPPLF